MSSTLQTERYVSAESKVGGIQCNPLTFELGWMDVASGLGRILFGYAIVVLMILLAVGLAFTAATTPPEQLVGRTLNVGKAWLIIGGAGIVVVLSIASFIVILSGKFKCAVNAPDRGGARWLIFGCILCIIMAYVVNIFGGMGVRSAGATFMQKHRTEMAGQFEADEEFRHKFVQAVMMPALTVYLISWGLNLATTVLFVLFLRAVGICFYHAGLTKSAELYLMFSFLLMGITAFMIFTSEGGTGDIILLAGLGIGWLVGIGWYIAMIFMARSVIKNGMAESRRREVYT